MGQYIKQTCVQLLFATSTKLLSLYASKENKIYNSEGYRWWLLSGHVNPAATGHYKAI